MSKAFTKDDGADEPPLVAPRKPLPPGVTNYVTPRGLASLRAEQRALEEERAALEGGDDATRRQARAALQGRLRELEARIASAVVVEATGQAADQVRFGARVTVRDEAGGERRYEIVGVDEADAEHGRVAFTSPIARAVLGKRVGEEVTLRSPRGEELLEVVAIDVSPSGVV
jgi:transcription elongation factor GreB